MLHYCNVVCFIERHSICDVIFSLISSFFVISQSVTIKQNTLILFKLVSGQLLPKRKIAPRFGLGFGKG